MRLWVVIHVMRHQILLPLRRFGQVGNLAVFRIDDYAFAGRDPVDLLEMILHVVSRISSRAANLPNALEIGLPVSAARHRNGCLRKRGYRYDQAEENYFHLLGSS